MALIKQTCPHCGAVVNVDRERDRARCEYCGTVLGVPPTPVPVEAPPRAGKGKLFALIALPMAIAVAGSLIAVGVRGGLSGSRYMFMSQGGIVLGDVNGDGVDDVIGRALFVYDDSSGRLVAFDGKSGAELWLSDVYAKESATTGKLVGAGDLVLLLKDDAEILGFDLRTGKRRFAGTLPEKARDLCEGPAGIEVVTADERRLVIDRSTGAAGPAPGSGGSGGSECWEANRDGHHGVGPGHRHLGWGYELREETSGMSPQWAFARRDGVHVALGYREKGSRVPMAAGLPSGGSWWVTEIPVSDPLRAAEGATEVATTSADKLFLTYTPDAKAAGGWGYGSRVAAFSLADGKRLWDVAVPLERGNAAAVRASGDRVYVTGNHGTLHIFAVADGKLLASRATLR